MTAALPWCAPLSTPPLPRARPQRSLWLWLTLILLLGLFSNAAQADGYCPLQPASTNSAGEVVPNGQKVASVINMATGMAINPWLVAGGIGAVCYLSTPQLERDTLHWSARPWFWGPLLGLATLFLLATWAGTVAPGSNKVADAVRSLEGMLQPIYSTPLVLGMVIASFVPGAGMPSTDSVAAQTALHSSSLNSATPAAAALVSAATLPKLDANLPSPVDHPSIVRADTSAPHAPASPTWFVVLAGLTALLIYGVMWLSTQAFNAMIVMCPFPWVDAVLRAIHVALLAAIAALSALHPLAGLLITLPLILVALLISGWCFRFTVFGLHLAWDLLSLHREHALPRKIKAFAGRIPGVAPRTLGWVERHADGRLLFHYRRWIVWPSRAVELSGQEVHAHTGLLFPSLIDHHTKRPLLHFQPRYRGSEAALVARLALVGVVEHRLKRGWLAVKQWFGLMFNRVRRWAQPEPAWD